ncbi:HAD-IB family hydrolase [Chitinophaga caeni]|uniref:HAD-IB family hydrolase n=1 Tax=Chitinophaga caeni TaxID=2029983 RepID=UPI0012FD1D1A|nr:HAD-IB family hydrolase [Chitinophaga caeni]
MSQNPGIAFFDFDGTITTKDTLFEIARFQVGNNSFYKGIIKLLPTLVATKMKWIPAVQGKEQFLQQFFKGMPLLHFNLSCQEFTKNVLPNFIRAKAISAITRHLSEGDRVIVVTASAENWVRPWCDSLGIECIGTRLQSENGKLTGLIEGINCNGQEKVNRIQQYVNLSDYSAIHAYGDTAGDHPMLQLAGNAVFKPFRD